PRRAAAGGGVYGADPRPVARRPQLDPHGTALPRPANRAALVGRREARSRGRLLPPPGHPVLLRRLPLRQAGVTCRPSAWFAGRGVTAIGFVAPRVVTRSEERRVG